MNDVEVCNLALSRIGQGASRPIQSLDEGGETANACKRVFAPAMASMLRESPWPFAQRSALLAASAETVDGWEYVYAYPDACAFVHAIGASGLDATRMPAKQQRERFRLVAAANGESLLIASNIPDARCWYSLQVTNPHFGDALFQDALAWRVAGELALALKADPAMATNAGKQYDLIVSRAMAAVGNEGGEAADEWGADSTTIQAYGGGLTYPFLDTTP
jgi:hypothetical protein